MNGMPADCSLQAREPGAGIAPSVAAAAALAGHNGKPADLRLLQRVLDGLRRLPGSTETGF